jgi:hypothetical protein
LPVVDEIAQDYPEVAFVAVAWKGTLEDTAARAEELMPSGFITWGLDAEEAVFSAYGVGFQPATVLIGPDKSIVDAWPGALDESEIRSRLDGLIASS